jgi:TonB family protein
VIVPVLAAALSAAPAPGTGAPPPPRAAAAPAATPLRIPGAWMRFGKTQAQSLAQSALAPVKAGAYQGDATWYGIPGQATLTFREDRLERIRFEARDPAPYWIDYAFDQLRRTGYRARWKRNEPGNKVCDWEGATLVHLEVGEHLLRAEISGTAAAPEGEEPAHAPPPAVSRAEPPAPAAPAPAAPAPTAAPATAAAPPAAASAAASQNPPAMPDTVPVFPATFVLGRAAPEGAPAVPALADSTPLRAPAYPDRARAAGVQGRVWVRVLVDTSGAAIAAEVARSIPELDSAAVAVARSCRFRPFAPQGARVRFRIEIPVTFTAR